MRIGASVDKRKTAAEWARANVEYGYGACVFPVSWDAGDGVINDYTHAANDAGIVIAEVGAWSKPLDPNNEKRRAAIDLNKRQLELAERVGARCCVNISGSRHPEIWMAPHKDNLTSDTFEKIVETVRYIIDAVKPKNTFYTLETMPWCFPDSLESYAQLVREIDRPAFAVHFDPCNLTYTPRGYFGFDEMVRRAAMMFGKSIKTVHVKDLHFKENAGNVEITEVPVGTGGLNLQALLEAMQPLDCPMMLEHLPNEEAYAIAASHIKSLMERSGIPLDV